MPELASVNGKVTPVAEAVVSIDDRGFLFGDAVYEAVRVYKGRPFGLDRHQARLARSLGEIGMTGVDVAAIGAHIEELIARSQIAEAIVYYQVSRGAHPRDHAPPPDLRPTVVVTVREFRQSKLLDYDRGAAVITEPDTRWGRVDIKTTNLLPNALARWKAKERGAYEAILCAGEIVREACATSAVIAASGEVIAPRQGPWILPSITRAIAEEICREEGIRVIERDFTKSEMLAADEILLLGSSTEIVGVVEVDGAPAGGGRVGPIARRLLELYRKRVAEGTP
jgi:D-alanine transaminase